MKVVVDVGNTHTILGLVKDRSITKRYRLETRPGMTADELLSHWITMLDLSSPAELDLLVASVVPELTNELRKLTSQTNVTASFLEPPWDETPVEVATHNPERVGADRVAGATALYHEFGSGIVVDFGTATTLDLVDPSGNYKGGVIFPGIEASAVGLSTQAAMLPQVSPEVPDSFTFADTPSGLVSGLFYGTAGAVERLIDELVEKSSLDSDTVVVATGGGAEDMNNITSSITHVRENLVLDGLLRALNEE